MLRRPERSSLTTTSLHISMPTPFATSPEYIAADSRAAADQLLARIARQSERLAATPGIGRRRPELSQNVRSFAVGNYVLFYREVAGGIEIVRVVHGRRELAAVFHADP